MHFSWPENSLPEVKSLNNTGCIRIATGFYSEAIAILEQALLVLRIHLCKIERTSEHLFKNVAGACSNIPRHFKSVEDVVRTDSSTLHLTRYTGKEEYCATSKLSTDEQEYHQVYCTPIVMEDIEWINASIETKSAVIIFNIAISHHLLGMAFLSKPSSSRNNHILLQKAMSLYELAFQNIMNASCGIDPICVPAILNNISHIHKIIEGNHSSRSREIDEMLVKAIFWWFEVSFRKRDSLYEDFPQHENAHIIEVFLEACYYVIGSPESIASAPAA